MLNIFPYKKISKIQITLIFQDINKNANGILSFLRVKNTGRHKQKQDYMAIRAVDLPAATVFFNTRGEADSFFIKNNPWKPFAHNSARKNFRYCVICGSARFSAEEWSSVARSRLGPAMTCHEKICSKFESSVTEHIPYIHYMVVTEEDRERIRENPEQDFFEKVGSVTSQVRIEKTDSNPYKLPIESSSG